MSMTQARAMGREARPTISRKPPRRFQGGHEDGVGVRSGDAEVGEETGDLIQVVQFSAAGDVELIAPVEADEEQ